MDDEARARLLERVYDDTGPPEWVGDRWLRAAEVAALFRVSRRTVSDWARAGKLESIVTPGGHRRFHASHVRAVLESRRATAQPQAP